MADLLGSYWMILSLLSAVLIVFTKFLDCHSTAVRLSHPEQERNRLARRWIRRNGASRVIWGGFGLAVLMTVLSFLLLVRWLDEWWWHLQFIMGALVVSFFQAAVAHHNYTGRPNRLTRLLVRFPLYR